MVFCMLQGQLRCRQFGGWAQRLRGRAKKSRPKLLQHNPSACGVQTGVRVGYTVHASLSLSDELSLS